MTREKGKGKKEKGRKGLFKKPLPPFTFTLLPLAFLAFQGCMLATQQDLQRLDDDLLQMRKNQADLSIKMSDLSGDLQALNSQLESSQQRMLMLSQKMDDLQADLARRLNVLSGHVTGSTASAAATPGDLYRLAANDYQAGKYDLALVGMRNVLAQFPKSEVAPQAQFNIGEIEFARKNWVEAGREFERAVQQYPRSEVVPKALYKKGLALIQAQRYDDAKDALQRLVKDYPRSELAKSARDLLKSGQP